MIYTATATFAITNAGELFYALVPADAIHEVISASVTEISIDAAASEQMEIAIQQVSAGAVGGGDASTPDPIETGGSAAGGTFKTGGTEITGLTLGGRQFGRKAVENVNGWYFEPIDRHARPRFSPTKEWCIALTVNLSGAHTVVLEVVFDEIGG